jgi:putative transposase
MRKNNAVPFPSPQAASADPLSEGLRQGARRLLAQALEAEVETLLACYADERDAQGR